MRDIELNGEVEEAGMFVVMEVELKRGAYGNQSHKIEIVNPWLANLNVGPFKTIDLSLSTVFLFTFMNGSN